jgi:hypothetical protein
LVKIAHINERQGHLQAGLHRAQGSRVAVRSRPSIDLPMPSRCSPSGRVSAQLGQLEDESRDALTQAAALFTRVRNARGWNDTMVQLGLLQVVGRREQHAGLTQRYSRPQKRRVRDRRRIDQQFTATVALGDAHWLLGHTTDARTAYTWMP